MRIIFESLLLISLFDDCVSFPLQCQTLASPAIMGHWRRVPPPRSLRMYTSLATLIFPVYYIYVEISVISAWFCEDARRVVPPCAKSWLRHCCLRHCSVRLIIGLNSPGGSTLQCGAGRDLMCLKPVVFIQWLGGETDTYSNYGGAGRRCRVETRDNRRHRIWWVERDWRVPDVKFTQRVPVHRPLRHSGLVRARHSWQPTRLLRLDATQDASVVRGLPRITGAWRVSLPRHAGQSAIPCRILLS